MELKSIPPKDFTRKSSVLSTLASALSLISNHVLSTQNFIASKDCLSYQQFLRKMVMSVTSEA
jgi:hypothetical protein